MKNGRTLKDLAIEIERQNSTKKDLIAPGTAIEMQVVDPTGEQQVPQLQIGIGDNAHTFGIRPIAHRQLAEHVGIPAKYYDRMKEEKPELLAHNVNTWLRENPAPRMVRTLDGNARALLSDRYRPLDNAEVAEAVLPSLISQKLEVVSCEVTEARLYIKAVDARVVKRINGNRIVDGRQVEYDDVCPSICISNSEVGMGALSIEAGMFTHACRNMAIFREKSLRKYHVGGKHELGGDLYNLLSDSTRRITDAATWSQVKDIVAGAFNEEKFEQTVARIQSTTSMKITADVVKVVDVTAKRFGTTEEEKGSILRQLISGGDLSQYGLFNAITRAAEDLTSYDRATEFERMGGEIIELSKNDWKVIAEAAEVREAA